MPEQETRTGLRPPSVSIDILAEWQGGDDFKIWINAPGGVQISDVNPYRMACASITDPTTGAEWTLFAEFEADEGHLCIAGYYFRAGQYRLACAGGGVPRYIDGLIIDALREEWVFYNERQAAE